MDTKGPWVLEFNTNSDVELIELGLAMPEVLALVTT